MPSYSKYIVSAVKREDGKSIKEDDIRTINHYLNNSRKFVKDHTVFDRFGSVSTHNNDYLLTVGEYDNYKNKEDIEHIEDDHVKSEPMHDYVKKHNKVIIVMKKSNNFLYVAHRFNSDAETKTFRNNFFISCNKVYKLEEIKPKKDIFESFALLTEISSVDILISSKYFKNIIKFLNDVRNIGLEFNLYETLNSENHIELKRWQEHAIDDKYFKVFHNFIKEFTNWRSIPSNINADIIKFLRENNQQPSRIEEEVILISMICETDRAIIEGSIDKVKVVIDFNKIMRGKSIIRIYSTKIVKDEILINDVIKQLEIAKL